MHPTIGKEKLKGGFFLARPKKQIDFDSELLRVDAQITRHENSVRELRELRKQIQQQKEQTEIARLYDLYKASGLSLDEMISVVSKGV